MVNREFTNREGKRIEAALLEVSGDEVTLSMEGGRRYTLGIGELSEPDQLYIRTWDNRRSRELGDFLGRAGYEAIELRFTRARHLVCEVRINGEPLNFLLDTGATNTVLDRGAAERLGLRQRGADGTASGVGGAGRALEFARVREMGVGPLAVSNRRLYVLDLTNLTYGLGRPGGADAVEGLLGADFLVRHGAVVDLGQRRLYLKPGVAGDDRAIRPRAKPASPSPFAKPPK